MFKVNNKDTRKTLLASGVFIVNFEHISHLVLVEEDKYNVSYFCASVLNNNYVTFNVFDEIKRLVFIFSLCEQTFVEMIIFENLY